VGALSAGACTLIVDSSGLAGAPAGDTGDASDARYPGEGGAEDVGVDAGGQAFCTSAGAGHELCADFDDGPYSIGWTSVDSPVAGTFATDEQTFASPPRSLLVDMPSVMALAGQTRLVRSFLSPPTRSAHLAFRVNVCAVDLAAAPATGYFEIAKLARPSTYGVELKWTASGFFVDVETERQPDGGGGADHHIAAAVTPLVAGRWTLVELDVVYDATNGSATLRFDHAVVANLQGSPTVGATKVTATMLKLGLYAGAVTPACGIRFDDVLLDLDKP
jgi:hypothetical protein